MQGYNQGEWDFSPDSQLLETQLKYYVCGDESRRAQNTIVEFAISLKNAQTQSFTTYLNVGLQYHLLHINQHITTKLRVSIP